MNSKCPCRRECPDRTPGCCCVKRVEWIAYRESIRKEKQRVLAALRTGNVTDASQWSMVQDRFFREMQSTSRLFGLSPDGLL